MSRYAERNVARRRWLSWSFRALGSISVLIAIIVAANSATAAAADAATKNSPPLGAAADNSGADEADTQTLTVGGGRIRLIIHDQDLLPARTRLAAWVQRSAKIVAGYYGRFPVTQVELTVAAWPGGGVRNGRTVRDVHSRIMVHVGVEVSDAELRDDWVLVHEMIHLALPNLSHTHVWLSEGIATYVEGVARARAGDRDPRDVWAEFMRSMPQGLPQKGDQGLDYTHTWGRTYWGGALFCLRADIEILERTHNRKGLQDALIAVMQASDDDPAYWPIAKVIDIADRATGAAVLSDLYESMKDKPVSVDLPALWTNLGLQRQDDSIRFDDSAPRAAIRRQITP
jgi:hypothetical protein